MLASVSLLVFVMIGPMAPSVKIALFLAFATLLFTYYPIKQRFTLSDGQAEKSILVKANFFGRISIAYDASGKMNTLKMGKLSATTQQMIFALPFGDQTRSFTLIHLGNARYFLLSEQVNPQSARAAIVENTFCF